MPLKSAFIMVAGLLLFFVVVVPLKANPNKQPGLTPISGKIDPSLLSSLPIGGQKEFIVFLAQQADLTAAINIHSKEKKAAFVYQELTRVAKESQVVLIALLESQGATYRPYWIANMIWVYGSEELLQILASRSDVAYLYSNPRIELDIPLADVANFEPSSASVIEWNIELVNAPEVWELGHTGQDVVIGGQDTGYDWTHPALQHQYRGWDDQKSTHAYNWHDAIHTGGGICGADAPAPCDDNGHGTHTMGIMVGDDGNDHKIGMAPGAKWIGCRNMDRGVGTPITYSECYQWFIAPTDLNDENPDPTLAPDVINNSWSCPGSEGCTDPAILRTVVENVRASGIVTVHSAGNYGPGCGTIDEPAANYDASFTVGATSSLDTITYFSSRGPAVVGESTNLKPDVAAPGSGINSSVPGGGYGQKSGTSMAGPHVAGLVALVISADPSLAGDVDALELFITRSAVPKIGSQTCGGIAPGQIPNNDYGFGRIDALQTIKLVTGTRNFFPLFISSAESYSNLVNR